MNNQDEYLDNTESAPIELKKMENYTADCVKCRGAVKMLRDPITLALLPQRCWCLGCGQPYFYTGELEMKDELKKIQKLRTDLLQLQAAHIEVLCNEPEEVTDIERCFLRFLFEIDERMRFLHKKATKGKVK